MKPTTLTPQTEDDWFHKSLDLVEIFSPSAPINKADLFAGRSREIIRLIDAVYEPGRHAVIFGERGVGKTSLAITFHKLVGKPNTRYLLPHRKAANPSDNFSSLWRRVFAELEVDSEDGGYLKRRVSEYYQDEITPDDVITELSHQTRGRQPLIIIDEFDKLADEEAKRLMSHTIKGLSDSGVNAKILLVGVAEDIHLLVAEHESIGRCLTEIKMPRMTLPEMSEILDKRYPRVGMSIEHDAKWKILVLSRGLPPYVHLLGREAGKSAVEKRSMTITEADVDEAIRAMLRHSDESENEIYRRATASNKNNNLYKQVILACAIAPADEVGYFAPVAIVEPLSTILKRPVKIANFLSHLNAFTDPSRGAILERTGSQMSYRYRFREPKMQPFVAMRGLEDGMLSPEAWAILSTPALRSLSSGASPPSS